MIAGIDIGATKTLAVLWESGRVVDEVRLATGDPIATAMAALDAMTGPGLDAIGIGIPGLVAGGAVRYAVNLGIDGQPVPIGPEVSTRAGVPVVVENDVNAAAVGAAHALGTDDLAYLSIGTGVAAGIVLGGRLHRGANGAAGEIGHLPVDPAGPRCACGQRGCLDVVASGGAITRRWPAGDAPSPAAALLAAADAGDADAIAALDELAAHLASAVTVLALTFDPRLVVLGGGVAEAGREPLLGAIATAVARRATGVPLLAALGIADRLRLVPDGVAAGAVGAALLATSATTSVTSRRWPSSSGV